MMTTKPITYISFALGPKVGANDVVVGVRVVPNGKDGNEVYGRTLNPGEPDSGDSITLQGNEELVLPPGSVKVTLEDIDRYAEPEPDGYATVTNTVWTWLQVPPLPDEAFFHYLLAASRRLDRAHGLWVSALGGLGACPGEPFIKTRARLFNTLGDVDLMCVSLNRAIRMIKGAHAKFSTKTAVPSEVDTVQEPLLAIRDAFEHIDERAMGKARHEGLADAMSIFNQGDLVTSGILRYAGHSLDLRADVNPALLAARKFILDVVAEAGTAKTYNGEPIRFGPIKCD